MNNLVIQMNKIIINDKKIDANLEKIEYKEKETFVKEIYLDILNDSTLEVEYNIEEEIKINIFIHIRDNVKLTLKEKKMGNNFKIKYSYFLGKNSHLIINKINDGNIVKEYDLINLDGEDSSVKYVLKTICKSDEKYDIVVNHHKSNTTSEIITNGINLDGSMIVNVTGFVPKNSINSILNQNNRIINLTDNKCQINPILLIDEEKVNASHSAHISNFSKEDLFYLMTRGISLEDANKLLIKGFLNSETKESEYIDSLIKKYWG